MTERLTYLGHSGTSIPETEIVYHILSSMLGSVEEEEIATNDSRIYTVLEIHFPVLYGDDFFALFTADKWRKLKNVITEIKKRSGKSQMKIVFSFPGVYGVRGGNTTRLVLQTMETDYKNVERAIDRVEVLVEIIESQMSEMPADLLEITYCYESTHARWRPAFVKTVKSIYKYTNDNWKIID